MLRLVSLAGLLVFVLLAWLISEKRSGVKARIILWGIGLQAGFAFLVLKTPAGLILFKMAGKFFGGLVFYSNKGAAFLFGTLVSDYNLGAIVAFQVLPIIIFVSSIAGILYMYGIIQFIVKMFAWVMRRTMKISGLEAFLTSLFIFMGIETITTAKKYIEKMTRSELFTMMTGFMATIATSVMAAYVSFGASAGHLLAASIMSAPAAVVISKIMIPETKKPLTVDEKMVTYKSNDSNIIEAAANGAYDGLKLAAQVGAMLIAFVGIIFMINGLFEYTFRIPFERVLGYVFSPFAFLMGVEYKDCLEVGRLLGTKTVFNEFLAYLNMGGMIKQGLLSERSVVIATYALCGFSNFGSIAIMIGGVGALAPSRKKEVAALGLKALVSGTLACFMTACIASILI